MADLVCKNCGYRFKSENNKKCPYCGDGRAEREKTAEELIDSFSEE